MATAFAQSYGDLLQGYDQGYYPEESGAGGSSGAAGPSTTTVGNSTVSITRRGAGITYGLGIGEDGGAGNGSFDWFGGATTPAKTTTTTTKNLDPMPEFPELEEFVGAEEWSPEKRAAEVQKEMGITLREARRALRESTAGISRSPDPASRRAMQRALGEHGITIERGAAGARQAAETAEANELARKNYVLATNYQAYLQNRNKLIDAALQEWLSGAETITTTEREAGGETVSGTAMFSGTTLPESEDQLLLV